MTFDDWIGAVVVALFAVGAITALAATAYKRGGAG